MVWVHSAVLNLTISIVLLRTFVAPFFRTGKCLEHPIIFIIIASVYLFVRWWHIVTNDTWLYRPFKLILLRLHLRVLTWVTFLGNLLCRSSKYYLTLIIIRARSGIALSWSHQPLINLFVPFKYTFIWASIVCSQSAFLCNDKVYFCNNRSISSWVLTCRRGRLGL